MSRSLAFQDKNAVISYPLQNDDKRKMIQNFNLFIEMKMIREMGTGLSNDKLADLDTPDRTSYRKAKASFTIVTMNETIAKWRCLSFAKASPSVPSVLDSVPSEVTRLCTKKINGNSTLNDSDLDNSIDFVNDE